jgi:hypothetical protein
VEGELRLLAGLHAATRCGAAQWLRDTDDPERDVYRAAVGADAVTVEFVYVPVADGRSVERLVVRVSGLGVYFQAAIGTPVYEAAETMLALQVFGWAAGTAGGRRALVRAAERVEALVASARGADAEPGAAPDRGGM